MIFTITVVIILGFGGNFAFSKKSDWSQYSKPINLTMAGLLTFSLIWYIAWYGGNKVWVQFGFGDMCTFLSPPLIVALILNKEKFLKAVAPWACLGAFIYLFFNRPTTWNIYWNWAGRFDALHKGPRSGINLNWLISTDIKHLVFLTFSFTTIKTLPRYTKKDLGPIFMFIGAYLTYDLLVVGGLGLFVDSGFFKFSSVLFHSAYYAGDYVFMSKMGIPYPLPTLLLYSLAVAVVLIYYFAALNIKKYTEFKDPNIKKESNNIITNKVVINK